MRVNVFGGAISTGAPSWHRRDYQLRTTGSLYDYYLPKAESRGIDIDSLPFGLKPDSGQIQPATLGAVARAVRTKEPPKAAALQARAAPDDHTGQTTGKAQRRPRKKRDWNEEDHPRDQDGKFASGGDDGGGGSETTTEATEAAPAAPAAPVHDAEVVGVGGDTWNKENAVNLETGGARQGTPPRKDPGGPLSEDTRHRLESGTRCIRRE